MLTLVSGSVNLAIELTLKLFEGNENNVHIAIATDIIIIA